MHNSSSIEANTTQPLPSNTGLSSLKAVQDTIVHETSFVVASPEPKVPNESKTLRGAVTRSTMSASRPLKIVFTVRFLEFGIEELYEELGALNTDGERARHVKQVLMECNLGTFTRGPHLRKEVGVSDQVSFKIRFGLSARDIGFDRLFKELLLLKSGFQLNNAVRRKIYDAFNETKTVTSVTLSKLEVVVTPSQLTKQSVEAAQEVIYPLAPATSTSREDRRRAANKANAATFEMGN